MSDLLYFCTQLPVALQSLQGQYADWLDDAKTKLRSAKRFPRHQHVFYPAHSKAYAMKDFPSAQNFTPKQGREIGQEPDGPPFSVTPQTGMLRNIRQYPVMKDASPGKIPRDLLQGEPRAGL